MRTQVERQSEEAEKVVRDIRRATRRQYSAEGLPMHTSNRSGFRHWPRSASETNRTAVYGPVCTVVWQGSAGNRCPYADQRPLPHMREV